MKKTATTAPAQEGNKYVPYGINGTYYVYDNEAGCTPLGFGSFSGTKSYIQKECDRLNAKERPEQRQKQRNNVSVEMLQEALKPFAEMCGEFSGTVIRQGGTVFQYNDKHLTVADFEKAEQVINYLSHHPIK